jgi:hypothetical protein
MPETKWVSGYHGRIALAIANAFGSFEKGRRYEGGLWCPRKWQNCGQRLHIDL